MVKITNGSGSLRGYTFTLSILILSATLIALAMYASEWRRAQQAAPANLVLPSEALAIGNRISSDVSSIIGGSAEISRNSTSVSIKITAKLPFKKEGFPVADVSDYASSIPAILGSEIPYEIVLTANNLNRNNSTVLILPDSGAVLFANNGTNDTDVITYQHPRGWNLTGISASIFCAKSQQKISNISPSAGAGAINYTITYSDLGGTYISTNATQLANNVTYSVSFSDGTNLSFVTNISASGSNVTTIYYTKSPGAVQILAFDSNSTNATGGVPDYSTFGKNMTLGGGNSSKAPYWLSSGCHSGGCYSFDGVADFINGSNLNFTEAPVNYTETTYKLNGGFENYVGNDFGNWVQVNNSSNSCGRSFAPVTLANSIHSGSAALKSCSSSSGATAYMYNDKAIFKNGTSYSLEFWATCTNSGYVARYALYDANNNNYLQQDGSWQAAQWIFTVQGSCNANDPPAAYAKYVQNFRTADTGVGAIQVRFYEVITPKGESYIDDVSLTQISDFTVSIWANSTASGGSALYQMGSGVFGQSGFDFSAAGGSISACLSSYGMRNSSSAAMGGAGWHHIALSVNRTGNYTLYLAGSAVFAAPFMLGSLNSTANFTIGSRNGSGFFAGSLDEIRFYNRSLSDSEIYNLYRNRYQDPCTLNLTFTYDAAGLANRQLPALYNAELKVRTRLQEAQLLMPFDMNVTPNQTGPVLDYSSKGTNGIMGDSDPAKSPVWTSSGKSGGAYVFDGANDYINMSSNSLADVTSAVTVSLWEKSTPPASGSPAFAAKYGATNGWELYSSGGYAAMGGRDGSGSVRDSGASSTNIADGNWHHLAGTVNNNIWSIYVDGALQNSTDTGYAGTNLATNAPLLVGQWNGAGSYVNGTIDEVRIYSRALTASEIYSLYRDSALVQSGPLVASSD